MAELLRFKGRVNELARGMQVRRVLPNAMKRSVGPFVFFDHFGPVDIPADMDNDVGGHPHIGLATVSYLFEGSLMHRDSIGSEQLITPGAINWMTAGRGIVHSERVPDQDRNKARRIHGLQLWVALPPRLEEIEPAFQHVSNSDIPEVGCPNGVKLRVLVGAALGLHSPVQTASPTLYLDVQMPANSAWELPALFTEMAIYSPEHALSVFDQAIEKQEMTVLPSGVDCTVFAGTPGARFVVIGGAPLEQPVHMWWNYVSTDKQRIAHAANLWSSGGFDPIPGDPQRITSPVFSNHE